ncbi:hypothetical protein RJ639_011284 [Escallonia herrerae]|uniref:Zinc finger, CCHC-type n=1 Tax=Escallonia herrerae TaxID=1293975 RepID=A0AA89AST1_9ASTE|nr:hypothetical protein RJ639_011284 [Escallonia herrerae]
MACKESMISFTDHMFKLNSETVLLIAYVLTIPKPIVDEVTDEAIKQTAMKQKQKWEEDATYCKGYILGGLSDTLYDVYEIKYANSSAKELWDDLDSKYKTEDTRNKKFQISKLFDFRMIDNKSVITQIHELQMIMNLIISEGHSLDESFQPLRFSQFNFIGGLMIIISFSTGLHLLTLEEISKSSKTSISIIALHEFLSNFCRADLHALNQPVYLSKARMLIMAVEVVRG